MEAGQFSSSQARVSALKSSVTGGPGQLIDLQG
jgi:hypothetical protein